MPVRFQGREIEAFIFDLGDTLISVSPRPGAIEAAFAEIADLLTTKGYDPVPGGARLRVAVGDFVDSVIAEPTPEDREVDHRALAADAYRRLGLELDGETLTTVMAIEQHAWHESVSLLPGAMDVLTRLRSLGLRLAICSNAPYDPASMKTLLARLDLTGHVDEVILSTDSGYRKPSPKMFAFVLNALGVSASKTVFVGDKDEQDVNGARAARMLTVLVRDGNAAKEDPKRPNADAVVAHLEEILKFISGDSTKTAGYGPI